MKKRLKDLADFRIGYQFRGKVEPDPAGNVRVIQIKDIDADLRIRIDGLAPVKLDRPEPYLTQEGDVLFLSRGHRLYAVVVPATAPNTIATGYFFILRPKTRVVLPEYLAWSMNQGDFQEALRPFHRGSYIPMVSKTDVQDLLIRVPPLEVQRQILQLHALLDEERRLAASLQEKRTALIQAVSRKLLREQRPIKDQ